MDSENHPRRYNLHVLWALGPGTNFCHSKIRSLFIFNKLYYILVLICPSLVLLRSELILIEIGKCGFDELEFKSNRKCSYDWTDIHQWLNTWLTTSIGDGIWLHAEKFKNPKTKFKNRILIFSTKWEWFEIKSIWIHFQSNLIDLNLHLKKLFGSKHQIAIRSRFDDDILDYDSEFSVSDAPWYQLVLVPSEIGRLCADLFKRVFPWLKSYAS